MNPSAQASAPSYTSPDLSQRSFVFIVGNSRSGNTLMMRMLDEHSEVAGVNEVHFFENLWNTSDGDRRLPDDEGVRLVARLLSIQRDGYIQEFDFDKHRDEARAFMAALPKNTRTITGVFARFLLYETERNGKTIPVEKTPQNVFYLDEILRYIPNVKIINMVRDPRAVLLSQKNKGKRSDRAEYGRYRTKREDLRLRINYHPITISRLWNSSVSTGTRYLNHPQVINMRFEDLLAQPEQELHRVCDFVGIDYQPSMLEIYAVGSSNAKDNFDEKGIQRERVHTWKKGGLSNTEIYLCQRITRRWRQAHGYPDSLVRPHYLRLLSYYASFPVKLGLSVLFNLNRMKSVVDAIKRRL